MTHSIPFLTLLVVLPAIGAAALGLALLIGFMLSRTWWS